MKEIIVSWVISHGASQKARLSLPLPYLREALLWSTKTTISFRAFVGHVLWLWLVAMPVWIILGGRTIALFCWEFIDLLQSIF